MKRKAGGLGVTCFTSWAKPPGQKSSGLWFYLKKKAEHPQPSVNGQRGLLRQHPSALHSVTKKNRGFCGFHHRAPWRPAQQRRRGPTTAVQWGGDLAVFYPILNFLVYFAIFSFLYRGFAVVFLIRDFLIHFAIFIFYTGLPVFILRGGQKKNHKLKQYHKYVSVIMKHRPKRKKPQKNTGSANYIA